MSNNIEWKKSSIDYDKLNSLTHKSLIVSNVGKNNKESGLLKRAGRLGGLAVGNHAHKRLNEAQTSESRSKALTKKISKTDIVNALKDSFSLKEACSKLNLSEVTLRKNIRLHSIDSTKHLKKMNESVRKQKFASYGGKNTNKPILCYHYPSMKFYKEFNSIKEASDIMNLTGISGVLRKKYKQHKGYYFEYKK